MQQTPITNFLKNLSKVALLSQFVPMLTTRGFYKIHDRVQFQLTRYDKKVCWLIPLNFPSKTSGISFAALSWCPTRTLPRPFGNLPPPRDRGIPIQSRLLGRPFRPSHELQSIESSPRRLRQSGQSFSSRCPIGSQCLSGTGQTTFAGSLAQHRRVCT